MGNKVETEIIHKYNSNPSRLSLNNIKKSAGKCKSKYENNSIIKSLSSYSACTDGEKYFTNPKGQHYFYTRTGNRHLLVPSENVLKGKQFLNNSLCQTLITII